MNIKIQQANNLTHTSQQALANANASHDKPMEDQNAATLEHLGTPQNIKKEI